LKQKNSPHTYTHEGFGEVFLFESIEQQWVQTDFLCLADNNNTYYIFVPLHSVIQTLSLQKNQNQNT